MRCRSVQTGEIPSLLSARKSSSERRGRSGMLGKVKMSKGENEAKSSESLCKKFAGRSVTRSGMLAAKEDSFF